MSGKRGWRKGRGRYGKGREEEGGEKRERKGAMGVDPTKFGKKIDALVHTPNIISNTLNNKPIASRLQRVKLPTSFKIDKLLRPK